jgi:hypothetical protein
MNYHNPWQTRQKTDTSTPLLSTLVVSTSRGRVTIASRNIYKPLFTNLNCLVMDQTRECPLQSSSVSGRHPESCDGALWDLKKTRLAMVFGPTKRSRTTSKRIRWPASTYRVRVRWERTRTLWRFVDNQGSYLGQLSCGLLSQCVSDSVAGASTGYWLQLAFVLQMMS